MTTTDAPTAGRWFAAHGMRRAHHVLRLEGNHPRTSCGFLTDQHPRHDPHDLPRCQVCEARA